MFVKNKILVSADFHIGVHNASEVWHKIALDHARHLVDVMKEHNLKDLVISGDLFHDRNDISVTTLDTVTEIFDLWKSFNIFLVVGNHDAFFKHKSDVHSLGLLKGWPNIIVIDQSTIFNYKDKKIGFVPWGADVHVLPKCDIIFGHFEISTFKFNQYKVCEHGLNPKDLLEKSPLIITGHFHINSDKKYKNGRILYTGNPHEMDFGDFENDKGLWILDVSSNELEFIKNDISPKHKKIRYSEKVFDKKEIEGNIICAYVDEDIETSEIDAFLAKIKSLNPLQLKPVQFEIDNSLKEGISEINASNGVKISDLLTEYIDKMGYQEDQKNKILNKTLEYYKKYE